MKNLVSTFVVLFFSFSAFAQKEISREQVRLALAESMVSFVESLRPEFTPGMTYSQFQTALVQNSKPTLEGAALLRKAHEYLSTKTSNAAILQNYSATEMASVYGKMEAIKANKGKVEGQDIFSMSGDSVLNKNAPIGSIKCRWYDLPCHFVKLYLYLAYGGVPCIIASMSGNPCD